MKARNRRGRKDGPAPEQFDLFSMALPVSPAKDVRSEIVQREPVPPPVAPPAAPQQRRPRSLPRVDAEVPLKLISVSAALLRYGIGRTKFYELVGRGHVKTVKLGAKTLVDVMSGDAYFDALPTREQSGSKPMSN